MSYTQKIISLFFLSIVASIPSFAQKNHYKVDFGLERAYQPNKNNALYFEFGGAGIMYSLNYEHRIPFSPDQNNLGFYISPGVSTTNSFSLFIDDFRREEFYFIALRMGFSLIYNQHRFDLGYGQSIFIERDRDFFHFSSTFTDNLPFLQLAWVKVLKKNINADFGVGVQIFFDEDFYLPWPSFRIGHKI